MMPVPHLDLFSIKAMTLITVLVVSLWTLFAWRINRPVAGMRLFAQGLLSICFGSVLGLSRLVVPGNAILIAGNVFMVGGMITTIQGIRGFRGFPPLPGMVLAGLVAVVSVSFLYWMFVHDSFGMRVAVISAALALLAIDATVSMFRRVPGPSRLTYWPTGFAFGFAAAFLSVRVVAALSGYYGDNLLAPVPIEVPLTICANVAYVACAFGMLIASNTQLRGDAEKMAQFDPLTNLPNRRLFLDRLLEAEHRTLETGLPVGVIYLDLDGFKQVNDTLGHEAGDTFLRNVSAAMIAILRRSDCLARVGGDEFVILVEDVKSRAELTTLAERLKTAVGREAIPGFKAATVRASCGVAIFPDDGGSAHDVMREADTAMYNAKRRARVAGPPTPL